MKEVSGKIREEIILKKTVLRQIYEENSNYDQDLRLITNAFTNTKFQGNKYVLCMQLILIMFNPSDCQPTDGLMSTCLKNMKAYPANLELSVVSTQSSLAVIRFLDQSYRYKSVASQIGTDPKKTLNENSSIWDRTSAPSNGMNSKQNVNP